MMMNNKML